MLDIIADKWTVLIIGALSNGTRRFQQLRREVDGVTQKMLTQTLWPWSAIDWSAAVLRDGPASGRVQPHTARPYDHGTALGSEGMGGDARRGN